MKAITLRDVPEPLAREIEDRARRTGASLNRTVVAMLAERSVRERRAVYDDLDHLAGTWSAEEADAVERAVAEQRRVDPEQWA